MHFGLTDARGAPKPQLTEMATFGQTLDQVGFARLPAVRERRGPGLPSYLDTVYPFTVQEDRTYLAGVLRQAYVSARLADLPPALTRESTGIGQDARLYLVPLTKQLLSPTWHQLEALAEGGAVVYVSYSPGAHGVHAGPWFARLNGMFGVQHELGYGAPARTEGGPVTFTLAQDFGTLPQGAQLTFAASGGGPSRSYLPVRPDGAEVLAVDSRDRPGAAGAPHGRGGADPVHVSHRVHGRRHPGVNPDATSILYDALATYAGARRPVTVDDPRVAADVLVRADGTRFAWLVSHAAEPVTIKPQVSSGSQLCGSGRRARQRDRHAGPLRGRRVRPRSRPAARPAESGRRQLAAAMARACALSSWAAALVLLPGSLSQMIR